MSETPRRREDGASSMEFEDAEQLPEHSSRLMWSPIRKRSEALRSAALAKSRPRRSFPGGKVSEDVAWATSTVNAAKVE
jgi:hypothetical protein